MTDAECARAYVASQPVIVYVTSPTKTAGGHDVIVGDYGTLAGQVGTAWGVVLQTLGGHHTYGTWILCYCDHLSLTPPGQEVTQASPVLARDYPHVCPGCGAPAFLGIRSIDCSSAGCRHHQRTQ